MTFSVHQCVFQEILSLLLCIMSKSNSMLILKWSWICALILYSEECNKNVAAALIGMHNCSSEAKLKTNLGTICIFVYLIDCSVLILSDCWYYNWWLFNLVCMYLTCCDSNFISIIMHTIVLIISLNCLNCFNRGIGCWKSDWSD